MSVAIRVEGLSKCYPLVRGRSPRAPYRTLREDLERLATAPLRWWRGDGRGPAEPFWALKDVSFEVQTGEVVGIIGRNGAGKSTLLKVLSRITRPSSGRVRLRGRVGSLLEVGTGFHPELTGRENIYLNGAILGMGRAEITRKFDEIVAFAELDAFLELPVKRYSSGMTIRLAFAVAAHLETEVLILDEVLAVGDLAFQRKCLGKMRSVVSEGRTALFVSHNMQAVAGLTHRCCVLSEGQLIHQGATAEAIAVYMTASGERGPSRATYLSSRSGPGNYVTRAEVLTSDGAGLHRWGEPLELVFVVRIDEPQQTLCFSCQVVDDHDQPVCHLRQFDPKSVYRSREGMFRLTCRIPKCRLFMGTYTLRTWLSDRRSDTLFESVESICAFEVTMAFLPREEYEWKPGDAVYIEECEWHLTPEGPLV